VAPLPRGRPKPKRSEDVSGVVRVAAKNANGSGSIYFEASAGQYRATYVKERDLNGRVIRQGTLSGSTKQAVEQRRAEAVARLEAEMAESSKLTRFTKATTVLELADWWLTSIATHQLRPSSLPVARQRLSAERLGGLASVPVVDRTVEAVTTWQGSLLASLSA
jgi:hypothetical protein